MLNFFALKKTLEPVDLSLIDEYTQPDIELIKDIYLFSKKYSLVFAEFMRNLDRIRKLYHAKKEGLNECSEESSEEYQEFVKIDTTKIIFKSDF